MDFPTRACGQRGITRQIRRLLWWAGGWGFCTCWVHCSPGRLKNQRRVGSYWCSGFERRLPGDGGRVWAGIVHYGPWRLRSSELWHRRVWMQMSTVAPVQVSVVTLDQVWPGDTTIGLDHACRMPAVLVVELHTHSISRAWLRQRTDTMFPIVMVLIAEFSCTVIIAQMVGLAGLCGCCNPAAAVLGCSQWRQWLYPDIS